jgi:hypothetical protein
MAYNVTFGRRATARLLAQLRSATIFPAMISVRSALAKDA